MKDNQLSSESFTRRVYKTTDPIEKIRKDEYFNPFRFRLTVDDVIIVNAERRHQLIVTQTDPFVKTQDYMDYDARIEALESAVAMLKGVKNVA